MKTTIALFLVLCLVAVQAKPSGEEGTSAGAGTGAGTGEAGGGAGSGSDGGSGTIAGSGSDGEADAGADSGSDGGAGSGSDGGVGAAAGSGCDGGAGAAAGSGCDGEPGDANVKRTIDIKGNSDLANRLSDAGEKLVVIDFMTTWCSPCKFIRVQLEKLANEFADSIVVLNVDAEEQGDIATKYNIITLPTFVFVKNSTILEEFLGANFERVRSTVLKLK